MTIKQELEAWFIKDINDASSILLIDEETQVDWDCDCCGTSYSIETTVYYTTAKGVEKHKVYQMSILNIIEKHNL